MEDVLGQVSDGGFDFAPLIGNISKTMTAWGTQALNRQINKDNGLENVPIKADTITDKSPPKGQNTKVSMWDNPAIKWGAIGIGGLIAVVVAVKYLFK